MKMYGISETSNEQNIRKISSLLDRCSLDDLLPCTDCVNEKENLGREGDEGEIVLGEGELCGDEGERVLEEDRARLSISRQIMLDISKSSTVMSTVYSKRRGRIQGYT